MSFSFIVGSFSCDSFCDMGGGFETYMKLDKMTGLSIHTSFITVLFKIRHNKCM